jgi:hydrogenase 3 maturation protease
MDLPCGLPTPTPDPSLCMGLDAGRVDLLQGEGQVSFEDGGQLRCPPSSKSSSPLSASILRQEIDALRGEGGKGGEGEGANAEHAAPWGRKPRLAIVGVGRAGQADDGAGPALCAALQELGGSNPDRLVVDGGAAPENVTGLLRRFRPDVVVLVDAAAMSERPGAVRWLERGCALGCSASTHTLPLGMLATYLRESLGCDVRLLGIQPAIIGEEGPLSAPVRRTVERLARRLTMVKERSG